MSYQEKKGKKNNNRKEKKKKHLTVVDPETLFMRNSKVIYCPKACIAQYQKFSNGRTCVRKILIETSHQLMSKTQPVVIT